MKEFISNARGNPETKLCIRCRDNQVSYQEGLKRRSSKVSPKKAFTLEKFLAKQEGQSKERQREYFHKLGYRL